MDKIDIEDEIETPSITAVEPREGFHVRVSFSDGVNGEFDAAEFVEWTIPESYDRQPGVPPRWRDRSFFESVRVDEDGWALHWGYSDGLGNDIWLDDYRAYAAVLGRPPHEVKVEWWGEDPEPFKWKEPIAVEARDGFTIWIEFDDGVSGEIDLSHLAGKEICKAWLDRSYFEQVHIPEYRAIAWPGGQIDLCPDSLYMRLTGLTYEEVYPDPQPIAADA